MKAHAQDERAKLKPNHLANETSPYLLQHVYNPVDWYPWGPEALEKSLRDGKPILLSIGYSSCHWCHVMAHESFESEEIGQIINEHFVPVKVDREERPDLDEIYMKSVQLMTGHGGWPMTVFLTPELKPFFGGTYYPPEDRQGLPGFKRLLLGVAQAWSEHREDLNASSNELAVYMDQMSDIEVLDGALAYPVIEHCIDRMIKSFDHSWGGFGSAPKFPQAFTLELAMRCASPTFPTTSARRQQCREIVETTLDRMCWGGMYDQIGGGFSRYAVDRFWRIPHFEKMLYDNATLSRAYLEGYLLYGRSRWIDVARDTLEFVARELRSPEGAFYSSLDADSEGQEGKYYVWKPEQVFEALGEEDGRWFNELFGITAIGNFEHGTSVPALSSTPESLAVKYRMSEQEFWGKIEPLKKKLFEARERRVRPGRDEKVLTSWNCLMISSFAHGYKIIKDERYLTIARDAANFVLRTLCPNGRVLRSWGRDKARFNGYLDDYACLIQALLDLVSVDFQQTWLDRAVEITDSMIQHFWDEERSGFYYTSDDHEQLITRTKSFYDGSAPSGTTVSANVLQELAVLTGKDSYAQKAEQLLRLYSPHAEKAPDQFANLLCALDRYLSRKMEMLLVADPSKEDWKDLFYAMHSVYMPNAVTALKDSTSDVAVEHRASSNGQTGWAAKSPLFKARGLVDGKPATYICSNYTCEQPITEPTALNEKLTQLFNGT